MDDMTFQPGTSQQWTTRDISSGANCHKTQDAFITTDLQKTKEMSENNPAVDGHFQRMPLVQDYTFPSRASKNSKEDNPVFQVSQL